MKECTRKTEEVEDIAGKGTKRRKEKNGTKLRDSGSSEEEN